MHGQFHTNTVDTLFTKHLFDIDQMEFANPNKNTQRKFVYFTESDQFTFWLMIITERFISKF